MSYTKRQFIKEAVSEIGLADYEFDLSPEMFEGWLRKLDSMIATWDALGIRLRYPLPGSPEYSDIDAETNVPDSAYEAIITNLAIKIAPTIGKQVSMETKIAAKGAYNALLTLHAQPLPKTIPGNMPSGAGNKTWRITNNPFVVQTPPTIVTPDAQFVLE